MSTGRRDRPVTRHSEPGTRSGTIDGMGFFDRNRANLVKQGIDPARLPPGQYTTDRFPVLHVGDIPDYEPGQWDLTITGLVDEPFTITLDELRSMPSITPTFDIHCVTKWSKFDTTWTGVRVRDLFARAGVRPRGDARDGTRRVRLHDEHPARRHHDRQRDRRLRVRGWIDRPTSMVVRCGWSCRISTSGSRRSGCARSS